MTNYFEIFITWPWFLFMFYRGCSRFFLSCQFESFLHELQDRKRKLKRSCFFFSFSLFVLALVIRVQCLLRNRVENENCQLKILCELRSLSAKSASFAKLPLAPCTSQNELKECPAKKVLINGLLYSYWRYIISHGLIEYSFSWVLVEKIWHSRWTVSRGYSLSYREEIRIWRIWTVLQSNHHPRFNSLLH